MIKTPTTGGMAGGVEPVGTIAQKTTSDAKEKN